MNHDTLDFESASARELASAVAARRVSALELCDAAIGRIEKLDGSINAVVVRDFERARDQARACDAALKRGASGALLGVPMTVKEAYNIAGLPTTWGVPPFRDFRPREDAVLVARLKAAGAVILGKTNVPTALADWQTANPIYGRTVNPYDPERSPGGSSGGGAAAVASRMVPLELGSDIGGSVRIPAHFCGIFGHKPSYGVLPLRGHDVPGTDGAAFELAVAGPLARTASDIQLAMDVLSGPDADEGVGYRLSLPPPRHETLAGCRVLLLDEHPCARTDKLLRDELHMLAGDLGDAGALVESRSSPLLPDLAAAHQTYMAMLVTIMTRGMPGGPSVISAHEWLGLLDERARVKRQWRALFDRFDVVLSPPFGTLAFEHVEGPDWPDPQWNNRTLTIDGVATPYGDQMAWVGIATLAGLPATIAPIAQNTAGLPMGVQIIGPYLGDSTTIAVARQIEMLERL